MAHLLHLLEKRFCCVARGRDAISDCFSVTNMDTSPPSPILYRLVVHKSIVTPKVCHSVPFRSGVPTHLGV